MDRWTQWIYQDAPRFGVDPHAAAAISLSTEWPSRQGAGDAGTSYGPFQLHVGGALPSGRGRKWAESRAGVDYALRQMAANGARGLRGPAAIRAISAHFERPADVAKEVRQSTAWYSSHARPGGPNDGVRRLAINTASKIQNAKLPTAPQQGAAKSALLSYLLSNVANYAQTGRAYTPGGLTELMLHMPVDAATEVDSGKTIPIVRQQGVKLGKNGNRIVQQAKQFLGTPYKWGGSKPGGFDCSGFVQYLYGKAGVQLGRTTYDQVKQGQPVGRKGLKAGDVIFFKQGSDVHHEALYIGNGKFIHAPHTGDVVKISTLNDPYYSKQFAGGRRFL